MISNALLGGRGDRSIDGEYHADAIWDLSDIETVRQIVYDGQSVLYAVRRVKGVDESGTEFGKKMK